MHLLAQTRSTPLIQLHLLSIALTIRFQLIQAKIQAISKMLPITRMVDGGLGGLTHL